MSAKEERQPIDWEAIEPSWRAGIKSVLQLAADYEKAAGQSISHTAINKHFKKLGVPRDLAAKVRAKADALVSASVVSGMVSVETTPKDAEIIDANAEQQANARISQRKDIAKARALSMALLEEIEAQTGDRELFASLGLMMAAPDEKGVDKLHELYMKVISTPSRIDSMKKLGETLKTLIALEREALGIDGGDKDKPASLIASALKALNDQPA